MEESPETLDLSNRRIKKLIKPTTQEAQNVTNLILDDNELQRLDSIDSFVKVQKLSVVRNQLLRMYGVCRLHSLHTLNLAHNGILTIEGLKDLVNLKWLCLAGNNIKTIEHLNTNINLGHLDLSENSIIHINDLFLLRNLKELLLHNNKINHLTLCERYLPDSLTTLTLANNYITDLNEISQLAHLKNLTSISIANNPCVNMTGKSVGFDYRPFVINWCLNVNVIDGYVVDAIESLRAEWLYSQGRGRHFRIGDQNDLVQYLASVCPLTGEALETEEDRKLRLILSKAQHHQQQLRDQSNGETPNPSPVTRKKLSGKQYGRVSGKFKPNKSPDRMSSSCYSSNSASESYSIMSQSMDPVLFRQNLLNQSGNEMSKSMTFEKPLDSEVINSPLQALSKMVPVPESLMSPDYRPQPLSRLSLQSTIPTPVSPRPSTPKTRPHTRSPRSTRTTPSRAPMQNNPELKKTSSWSPSNKRKENKTRIESTPKPSILRKSVSSDDDSLCDSKLETIQQKAEERRQLKDAEIISTSSIEDKVENAAIFIQKIWRGYYTRNKNKEVQEMFRTLQSQRANQYIQKLAMDMENTKVALESERKIQMLQTEAISALWKKLSAIHPDGATSMESVSMTDLSTNGNSDVIRQLAQTCGVLQGQIHQLQNSMEEIVRVMQLFSQAAGLSHSAKENGISTQTEIVAVHTPQGDAGKEFPFQRQTRPSSLPLPVSQRKKEQTKEQHQTQTSFPTTSELQQYAGELVDDVIKTVSETKVDTLGFSTTVITVTDVDQNRAEDMSKMIDNARDENTNQ